MVELFKDVVFDIEEIKLLPCPCTEYQLMEKINDLIKAVNELTRKVYHV